MRKYLVQRCSRRLRRLGFQLGPVLDQLKVFFNVNSRIGSQGYARVCTLHFWDVGKFLKSDRCLSLGISAGNGVPCSTTLKSTVKSTHASTIKATGTRVLSLSKDVVKFLKCHQCLPVNSSSLSGMRIPELQCLAVAADRMRVRLWSCRFYSLCWQSSRAPARQLPCIDLPATVRETQ